LIKGKNKRPNFLSNNFASSVGAELTENGEEDIVYDKQTSPKIHKEYKNII